MSGLFLLTAMVRDHIPRSEKEQEETCTHTFGFTRILVFSFVQPQRFVALMTRETKTFSKDAGLHSWQTTATEFPNEILVPIKETTFLMPIRL